VEHLPLAAAQRELILRGTPPGKRRGQARGGERGCSDRGMPDRGEQLLERRGLGHERGHAGFQCPEHHVVLGVRGEQDDTQIVAEVPQMPGQLHPVAVRQGDVRGHHVRLHGGEHLPGVGHGTALGRDLYLGILRG
jgi:hypothetical protein